MDKVGGMFKSKKDGGEKRAKKRKRTKDSNLDLNTDINLPSVEVDGNAEGAGKASISGESDFIVVDTPTMPKKEGNVNMGASAGTSSVSFDGDADVGAKGPKSPSLLRRIGMFFHIGGKSYNIEGEKKKKRRKVSTGSKEALNADISAEASVKRDDSFTIPDAEFKVPSARVSSDTAGAAGLTGDISGSAKADTSSSTDANIEAPSLGISSGSAIGLSAGMSGGISQSVEAEASSEVSAKAEANNETSLPSIGGDASMVFPSAEGNYSNFSLLGKWIKSF